MPRRRGRGAVSNRAEAFEILFDYKMGDLDIGEAYEAILNVSGGGEYFEGFPKRKNRQTVGPRKKRRKTKYQAAYSAAYKRLKKKHPRTSFGNLSKKAHAAARKKVK